LQFHSSTTNTASSIENLKKQQPTALKQSEIRNKAIKQAYGIIKVQKNKNKSPPTKVEKEEGSTESTIFPSL